MNVKSLLFLCGLMVGTSACMGQTRPAPDTSPLPDAASIAEFSATQARRLEAERRSGVIFETSRPGRILLDGQAPDIDIESPSKKTVEPEKAPENKPEAVPAKSGKPEQQSNSTEEEPNTDPEASEAHE